LIKGAVGDKRFCEIRLKAALMIKADQRIKQRHSHRECGWSDVITPTRQPVIRLALQGNTQMTAMDRRTGISRGLIVADVGRAGGSTGNCQKACH
jgi:hypothetical protein